MYRRWPEHFDWSWNLLRPIAASVYGGGEFNECLRTSEKIKLGDPESWHQAWKATADHVRALGRDAEASGYLTSAHDHYLRASNYYRWAEAMLDSADPRRLPTYTACVDCFQSAGRWFRPALELVEVPYEDTSLPGYFYPGAGTPEHKVPGVLYIPGADVPKEELYFMGGRGIVDRGMALLTVDGPGQGATIRLRKIPARYDTEAWVTPALDYLQSRPEVDPERLGVVGRSFAGYFSCRALAFEHRPKALVVFGAFYKFDDEMFPLYPRHWQWMVGAGTPQEAQAKLRKFTLEGIVSQINCPMLIVHGEDDHLVPVAHARRVYTEATCAKELVIYEHDAPGSVHCAYDSFPETMPLMWDWLSRQLGHKQSSAR